VETENAGRERNRLTLKRQEERGVCKSLKLLSRVWAVIAANRINREQYLRLSKMPVSLLFFSGQQNASILRRFHKLSSPCLDV
jgi:hypothetical protein